MPSLTCEIQDNGFIAISTFVYKRVQAEFSMWDKVVKSMIGSTAIPNLAYIFGHEIFEIYSTI